MTVQARSATKRDVRRVLSNLRKDDLEELHTYGLTDPVAMAPALMAGARKVFAMEYEGELKGICGVSPETGMEGAGRVWLLHVEGPRLPSAPYLRVARPMIETLAQDFNFLFNWKWEGNIHHIPWLQRLGFVTLRKFRLRRQDYFEIVRIT